MIKLCAIVCFLVTVVGCGSGSGGPAKPAVAGDFNGNWTLQGISINGAAAVLSGYSKTLTFDNSKVLNNDPTIMSIFTAIDKTSNCSATSTGKFVLGSNNSFTETVDSTNCVPAPCSLSFTVNGLSQNLACPGSFPVLSGGTNTVSVSGSTLTVSSNDGKGNITVSIYSKQ